MASSPSASEPNSAVVGWRDDSTHFRVNADIARPDGQVSTVSATAPEAKEDPLLGPSERSRPELGIRRSMTRA